jgi:hypothetical protein
MLDDMIDDIAGIRERPVCHPIRRKMRAVSSAAATQTQR